MKSSSFFKGLSWLIVLNLLVKPVWIFLIDRQVQNVVGYEEYGHYFSMLNLSIVLFFLADAGLSTMINQQIAAHNKVNMRQVLKLKLFLLFSYMALCFAVAWITGVTRWELLFYIVSIQALTSSFVFIRNVITAHQLFSLDAFFSVLDKFLMTVLCGSILYTSLFGEINLLLFLKIQTACTGFCVLLGLGWIAAKGFITSAGKEKTGSIVKRILPFAIIILLMGLHSRLDAFMLERVHPNGAYEAGVYASAYRLLDAANIAGYMVGSFLLPFIARNKNDKRTIESAVLNIRHGLLLLGLGIVSFVLVFAPWLQQMLYHQPNDYNTLIIRLCLGVLPAYYLIHIYGAVLTATEQFETWIRILIFSSAVNIILNIALIPYYGTQGCCAAALISQYICAVAVYIKATKRTGIRFQNKALFACLLAALLLAGLFYLGRVALISVWIILAAVSFIVLLLLTSQLKFLKKYFISLR